MQGTRPTAWPLARITRKLEILGGASIESDDNDVRRWLDRSPDPEQPCKPQLLLEIEPGRGERKQRARRADYNADNQSFETWQLPHVQPHTSGIERDERSARSSSLPSSFHLPCRAADARRLKFVRGSGANAIQVYTEDSCASPLRFSTNKSGVSYCRSL